MKGCWGALTLDKTQAGLIREIPARVKGKARLEAACVSLPVLGLAFCAVALISSCQRTGKSGDAPPFPAPDRPVAPIISSAYSDEKARDGQREADRVMDRLGVGPGKRVADIGAGAGYYTVRVARRLGPSATIYAEDVKAEYLHALETRLKREGIQGVRIVLGLPGDPKLPPASIDVAILSHMYHEVENPFELLYRLRPALALNARVGIIDADRRTQDHGTPPALLRCEPNVKAQRCKDEDPRCVFASLR